MIPYIVDFILLFSVSSRHSFITSSVLLTYFFSYIESHEMVGNRLVYVSPLKGKEWKKKENFLIWGNIVNNTLWATG